MVKRLQLIVMNNCIEEGKNDNSLEYWSNVLFARSIFALIPLSLLAVIPAIIICLQNKLYNILIFDLAGFITLIFIGYTPGLSVKVRKIILISLTFLIAFVFLNELGNFGPGLIFLLASSVFMMIFFPTINSKLPFIFTLIFCILYGFLIHFRILEIHETMDASIIGWVAIATNVLFLSAIITYQIPFLFSKLEATITEQNKLQASLIASNLELQNSITQVNKKNIELEQFAFVASHDLQEPLRMVASFLGKINKDYKDRFDEKGLQYIHFASDGAVRMKQVIMDLLLYSRAGNISEDMEEVDIETIIQEYKLLRRRIILEKSAILETSRLPVILSFKTPLTHVLHGLLDNAIKYSREGVAPVIKITTKENENEYLIAVEDNGIGIDFQYFDKIFIMFQRLHNRDEYSGTGIGLSIAKKHIESLGGRIWLESESGKGSIFYFSVPK